MRLKKTLFGNYRAKEVEDCIEALEEGFDREIQKKNEKIESLRKKIDSMKNQEKEIGEAVIYAKSLVIEAHDRAEKEAKEVLEKAIMTRDSKKKIFKLLNELEENTISEKEKEKIFLNIEKSILDTIELTQHLYFTLGEKANQIDEFYSLDYDPFERIKAGN